MAGQGRTLLLLSGVLVAAVAGVVWMVGAGDDESPAGDDTPDAGAAAREAPRATAPAAPRAKRTGNASVFGEIRRTALRAPVADQVVMLSPERGEPWTATTDRDGAFRFDKIPHGGPYELAAAAPGCATIRIPGLALDRNEERNLGTLFLDPSVKLTVRVRSGRDEPLAGAVVEAYAIPQILDWDWSRALAQAAQTPIAVARATTDAAGEVSFPETAVGSWTVTAKKDGFATGGTKRVYLRTGEEPRPVTIWLSPGHPLGGRVLGPDKAPVAGAVVIAAAPNSMWDYAGSALRMRVTTDAEGRYAFAALESGETQLSVARAGASANPVATVRVPLVPHFDIVLKGDAVVTGTVTEKEGGVPSEGATVRTTSWESGFTRAAEAVTGADGRYTIRTAAGAINRLTAEKPGFVQVRDESAQQQRIGTVREGETMEKDLVLRRGARLTGTVKSDGAPLAGARVQIHFARPNEGTITKSATADGEGRYEFASIDKGSVLVMATKEGHCLAGAPDNPWEAAQSPEAAREFKVEVPETGDVTKDLVLKRGSGIEGVVLGPDGAPLAGARVSAPQAADVATTGADGAFKLVGAKPGPSVRVWATKDGYVNASNKPVVVLPEEAATAVTIRMNREPRIRGTVTTASGAAPAEARVLLAHKAASGQDNPWEEQSRWQNAVRVAVRPDGTFDAAVTYGPGGKLLVRAVALDQQQADAAPIELVEGQELYETSLVLTPGTDLAGTVVAKGGSGVGNARVSIVQRVATDANMRYGSTGQYPVWAVTDAAGAFRIPHLAAAHFDVRAEADGFVAGVATANLADGKPVVVELLPELTIDGVVAYADGVAAEGVTVQMQPTSGREMRSFGAMHESMPQATSDAKGAFRLTGVAEGAYSLDVRPQWGSDLNIKPLRLDGIAAGSTGVKIVVERGGAISGRVADAEGRPLTQVFISANPVPRPGVRMTGNEWRNAQTKADGTFSVTGLAEGPYALRFQMGGGGAGAGYRPVSLAEVAVGTKDLAVVMEAGMSISGVVTDADGRPIQQLAVQAQQVNGQGNGSAYTDHEGKFNIAGLSAGSYRLEVAQWGGTNQSFVFEPPQTHPAGASGLRIVAGKGVTISGVLVDEAGLGLASGYVVARGKTGQKVAQAKGDGTFEIVGLETGQVYRLDAQSQGRVNVALDDVTAGAKDVRIVLVKGLEASGRLSDASGKPMPATHLSFTRPGGTNRQSAQTDAAGGFTVAGLVEGEYEARVYVQNADGRSGDWKVAGTIKGGDRDAELRLQ